MATVAEVRKTIQKVFKDISASPAELVWTKGKYIIAKYEERDPETGGHTYDYLYAVCDLEGNRIDDVSYGDLELAQFMISQGAVGDEDKIDEALRIYNAMKRKDAGAS